MPRNSRDESKRKDSKRVPASSAEVRKRMRATPQRDTPLELAVRSELHGLGLRFRVHQRIIPGLTRTADISLSRHKVAVFVDGCFWHGCPKHGTLPERAHRRWWAEKITANRKRDRDTDRRLKELGWKVIRVWEHEGSGAAASRIARLVRGRRDSHHMILG